MKHVSRGVAIRSPVPKMSRRARLPETLAVIAFRPNHVSTKSAFASPRLGLDLPKVLKKQPGEYNTTLPIKPTEKDDCSLN
jgi:hypothetical protein